jgi:hypothetical protein
MLQGPDRGSTEYFQVLGALHVKWSERSSGSAKPFTPELADVIDAMYWWGKNQNLEWYEDILVMLDEALDTEYDRTDHGDTLHGGGTLMAELEQLAQCIYHFSPKSFLAWSLYCFFLIRWAIAQYNYHASAPVTSRSDSDPESVQS